MGRLQMDTKLGDPGYGNRSPTDEGIVDRNRCPRFNAIVNCWITFGLPAPVRFRRRFLAIANGARSILALVRLRGFAKERTPQSRLLAVANRFEDPSMACQCVLQWTLTNCCRKLVRGRCARNAHARDSLESRNWRATNGFAGGRCAW